LVSKEKRQRVNEEAAAAEIDEDLGSLADDAHDDQFPDVEVELIKDPVVEVPEPDKGNQGSDTGMPARKLTKQEILERLFEKNELILNLSKKNVEVEAKCKTFNDKWLRSHAEFENYRKRTQKEWELLKHQARSEVILEILDVIDDFERAFSVVGERNDDFVKGIRLIYNNLMTTLAKSGVEKMEPLNTPFDPNFHMAVSQIERDDAKSNHVVEVIQEGYSLDGQVIRPAKVVIAK